MSASLSTMLPDHLIQYLGIGVQPHHVRGDKPGGTATTATTTTIATAAATATSCPNTRKRKGKAPTPNQPYEIKRRLSDEEAKKIASMGAPPMQTSPPPPSPDLIKEYEDRERQRRLTQAEAWTMVAEEKDGDSEIVQLRKDLKTKYRPIRDLNECKKQVEKYDTTAPGEGKMRERVVAYISRNTKAYERNYEDQKVVIISVHQPISPVLHSSANTVYSLRIDKFRMNLAPFLDSVEVWHKPGKQHVNVDPLSRVRNVEERIEEKNMTVEQQITVWDGEVAGMKGALEAVDNRVKVLLLTDSQAAISAVRNAGRTGKARTADLARLVELIAERRRRLRDSGP
ncbi:hypothetical protein BDZ91DRAFT_799707 [Kalaharituber pfeilii]|nr:hypothetical protein BDZ91DRAFT_799707 [Kalaharituber pfeilii]